MSRTPHGPGFEEKGIPSFLFNFDQFEKLDVIGLFDDRDGRVTPGLVIALDDVFRSL